MELFTTLLFGTAVLSLIAFFVGTCLGTDDDWPLQALAVCVISLLLGIASAFVLTLQSQSVLMEQCLQDHKEYECVALLSRGSRIPVR